MLDTINSVAQAPLSPTPIEVLERHFYILEIHFAFLHLLAVAINHGAAQMIEGVAFDAPTRVSPFSKI